MALQSNGESDFTKWRHAFVLLASIELRKPSPWPGPDDFEELRLRIETLVVLMALVPRNELGRLDEVVNYLGSYDAYDVPGIGTLRSEIRQLLAESEQHEQVSAPFRRAMAAVARKSTAVDTESRISSVISGNTPEDRELCVFGMGTWFTKLSQPAWTHVRLFASDDQEVPIDEVFVEVFAVPDKDLEAGTDGYSQRMRRGAERISGETNAVIDAATMIERTDTLCIVVGEPGIGKSTLVQWLAQGVATKRIPDFEAAIIIKLGPFAVALSETPEITLVEYFFDNLNTRFNDWAGPAAWLRHAAEEGTPYLLLLDGWDEVPPNQRDVVQARIDFERPYFTTVITSRPSGIPKRLATSRKEEVYHIAGLTREGRRMITERYLNATQRQSLYPDLIKQIENNRDIEDLACNPFMLSLLIRAIATGKTAPSQWTMAEVYELTLSWVVDEIKDRPQGETLALTRALPLLWQFSYHLLFKSPTPRYVFPEHELLSNLNPDQAIAVHSSRLVSRVDSLGSWFAFIHATFQEYFAAKHFETLGKSEIIELLDQAFISTSRNIVLEFLVGMNSEAGQQCQARLEKWMETRDRYNQVLYRIAQLLTACPPSLRPPLLVTSVRLGLWEQISGNSELHLIQHCATLYARLDSIGLCQDIRSHPAPNELILGTIAASIPPGIAQTNGIFDLMDPALREHFEAGLTGQWSKEKIETNRRVIANQAADHNELRQAIKFAGKVRDIDSVTELGNLLQVPELPESLQTEISRALGQIGGYAATRIMVDMVSEDIRCSYVAVGLARRALTHVSQGGRRLDPAGRDKLLRRIACLSTESSRYVTILSALQGYPIRFGTALLKQLAISHTTPESIRIACLGALEMALTDVEVDELLKQIGHQTTELESCLLALAVQRRRPISVDWLENRLRTLESPRDKRQLIQVALIMSNYGTSGNGNASLLLRENMEEALVGQDARADDLANYYRGTLDSLTVDHTHPPDWIDTELCRHTLLRFIDHEQNTFHDQVLLAASLLGYVPLPASSELLRACLQECSNRLQQPLNEMQVSLLNEMAGTFAQSLANLAPEWLLPFRRDLPPVNEVLRSLSERRGWLVFDERILDAEGQRVLAPWQAPNEERTKMAKVDKLADYILDDQPWYRHGDIPETLVVDSKRVTEQVPIDFVLVTATKTELKAVLRLLTPLKGESVIWEVAQKGIYYMGLCGIHTVAVTMCVTTGDGRAGGASRTTMKAIESWNPLAVIMVGTAFGNNPSQQEIGDVLVSEQVAYYGAHAIREDGRREQRGPIVPCSEMLLGKFKNALHWKFKRPDGYRCKALFGLIVSGPILVGSESSKRELLNDYRAAIGGEMDAAGMMEAASELKLDWIAVKSICDWGEGNTDSHLEQAAAAAASLVCFVLTKPSATDGLRRRRTRKKGTPSKEKGSSRISSPAQSLGKIAMKKTVVELDLVGYSTISSNLEEGLDVRSLQQLNAQIQNFVNKGLAIVNLSRAQTVIQTTGDGAILVFDSAVDAHNFAVVVHASTAAHNTIRTQNLAKRVFRIGAATGDIVMEPIEDGGFDTAGITIVRAVRLEAKATPGGFLVDNATFLALPLELQAAFSPPQTITGKRDEFFVAHALLSNINGLHAEFFTNKKPATSLSPALKIWHEKLIFLQEQEAIITDPAQKFAIMKQIEEAKAKIREYEGKV